MGLKSGETIEYFLVIFKRSVQVDNFLRRESLTYIVTPYFFLKICCLLYSLCTFRMKIQDAGMILEEQPAKVAEAVKLFLQGIGHTVVLLRKTNPNPARSKSLTTVPVKPAEPVKKEEPPELIEGIQDLKIRFSQDDVSTKVESNLTEEQLLPI